MQAHAYPGPTLYSNNKNPNFYASRRQTGKLSGDRKISINWVGICVYTIRYNTTKPELEEI